MERADGYFLRAVEAKKDDDDLQQKYNSFVDTQLAEERRKKARAVEKEKAEKKRALSKLAKKKRKGKLKGADEEELKRLQGSSEEDSGDEKDRRSAVERKMHSMFDGEKSDEDDANVRRERRRTRMEKRSSGGSNVLSKHEFKADQEGRLSKKTLDKTAQKLANVEGSCTVS